MNTYCPAVATQPTSAVPSIDSLTSNLRPSAKAAKAFILILGAAGRVPSPTVEANVEGESFELNEAVVVMTRMLFSVGISKLVMQLEVAANFHEYLDDYAEVKSLMDAYRAELVISDDLTFFEVMRSNPEMCLAAQEALDTLLSKTTSRLIASDLNAQALLPTAPEDVKDTAQSNESSAPPATADIQAAGTRRLRSASTLGPDLVLKELNGEETRAMTVIGCGCGEFEPAVPTGYTSPAPVPVEDEPAPVAEQGSLASAKAISSLTASAASPAREARPSLRPIPSPYPVVVTDGPGFAVSNGQPPAGLPVTYMAALAPGYAWLPPPCPPLGLVLAQAPLPVAQPAQFSYPAEVGSTSTSNLQTVDFDYSGGQFASLGPSARANQRSRGGKRSRSKRADLIQGQVGQWEPIGQSSSSKRISKPEDGNMGKFQVGMGRRA